MRPLPTPPATPSSSRSTGPPRPLPKPPLHRAQSHHGFQPLVPNTASPCRVPPGIATPPEASIPPPLQSAPSERPSIRLNINDIPSSAPVSSQNFVSPLSPIAFNLPGPRTLRKRREEELARRMKALGFVEAPSPTGEHPKNSLDGSKLASSAFPRASVEDASSTFTESDDERDVVLLIDHDSDADEHRPMQPPPRSASRAAMLSLFRDDSPRVDEKKKPSFPDAPYGGQKGQNPWKGADGDDREFGGRTSSHIEVRVDVEVEVVTKEAVARTKRRFSRKWVRERKGKRWTERDFGEILCQLRKLR
ncbi:hypothetical protein GSI_01361 [Ganoderma sinense ZZ0214-1]|uniref:Uncharacterized protein n=1 Tax=Ganoderma sinense ZZ0214-1 TaxID=1077348 RepID=A0A2G8SV65_9APHY|nr:hypothetical protein GSI_01361 [Ganoderma sinense ZZ0214-1]